jgi:hypothetical protein
MTAEANLYNPALFEGVHYPVWELVDEYMEVSLAYAGAGGVVIGCWAEHILYVLRPTFGGIVGLFGYKGNERWRHVCPVMSID